MVGSAVGVKSLTSLGIAVLALLFERPMHPYEMYQLLVQRGEDRIIKVRPGSLYHTVDRLAEQKLVRATGTDREGNRPERTSYEVTDAGRSALTARIAEILETPIREYPTFPIGLAEMHNLPVGEVVPLLERRIHLLTKDIAELDAMAEFARRNEVPRVFWVTIGYLTAVENAEVVWLTKLLAEIQSGELPWLETSNKRIPTQHIPTERVSLTDEDG